jgi:hypothetical protein
MEVKMCFQCNLNKTIDNYTHYFVKKRNKWRYSSYCKECACLRTRIYHKKNKVSIFQKKKEREAKNPELTKIRRKIIADRYTNECKEFYLITLLVKSGIDKQIVIENPELLQTKKLLLMTKRKLKTLKNGKKQIN